MTASKPYTILDYIETDGNAYLELDIPLTDINTVSFSAYVPTLSASFPAYGKPLGFIGNYTYNFGVEMVNTSRTNSAADKCYYVSAGRYRFQYNNPTGVYLINLKYVCSRINLTTAATNGATLKSTKKGYCWEGSASAPLPVPDGNASLEYFNSSTFKTYKAVPTWGVFKMLDYKNSVQLPSGSRFYGINVYENGTDNVASTLTHNLVPARRSGGEIGLYDTINNVFYTNAGTGNFIGGLL